MSKFKRINDLLHIFRKVINDDKKTPIMSDLCKNKGDHRWAGEYLSPWSTRQIITTLKFTKFTSQILSLFLRNEWMSFRVIVANKTLDETHFIMNETFNIQSIFEKYLELRCCVNLQRLRTTQSMHHRTNRKLKSIHSDLSASLILKNQKYYPAFHLKNHFK